MEKSSGKISRFLHPPFSIFNIKKLVLFLLLGSLTASLPSSSLPAESPPRPRLLLMIMVDQARYDYLERFAPVFEGGLRRLLTQGVVFTDAHQNHAVTSTGPGHAAISSGRYPAHSGIIDNQWFDRTRGATVNCVEDRGAALVDSASESPVRKEDASGRSPRPLLVDTLADWIGRAVPDSKIFGISRKDRGAILMAGHESGTAYWYNAQTGGYQTSTYYMDYLPQWVADFNAEKIPDRFYGQAWEPLPVGEEFYRRSGVQPIDLGWFNRRFPHVLGGPVLSPDDSFYADFGSTPLMDDYLGQFAERLIEAEQLGQDEWLDFLSISFSALDSVGHEYGPDSPEVLDCLVRLDRTLGRLFEFLDEKIGLDQVWIALSSDHGVVPVPEMPGADRDTGARIGGEDILCFQRAGGQFADRFGADEWILSGRYLNYTTIGRRNLLRQDVEAALARLLEQCPIVSRVWTRTELEQAPLEGTTYRELYRRSFHPGRSPDLHVQVREFSLASRGFGTSHGSPYEYDTHVPLIFLWPGREGRSIPDRVATVDAAPTLAARLGLAVPPDVDGRDLNPQIEQTSKR